MFRIKRNRYGDLILDINLSPFDFLLKLLSSLDIIFNSKIFYSIPMGLGIGFGIGIVVFSNPSSTIATTPKVKYDIITLTPHKITLDKQNYTSLVKDQSSYSLIPLKWTDEVINFLNFPGKVEGQVVIGTKDKLIENVSLGEKIKLEATNNGIYSYSIFHIREIASKDINSLMNDNDAKLIIINPTNVLGSNYLIALAK
ncbi:MAG: hypothetical protein OEX81_02585 [Candidatus Pacebacteria bacterium]|nr:hypothetical protein [Candidatus Paceibacterota bacterium]